MTQTPSDRHNEALFPLLKALTNYAATEPDQWVLLESLCLGIGKLHGRSARQTAEFIEVMAERLTTGERT